MRTDLAAQRQVPVGALATGLVVVAVKVATSTPRLSAETALVAITWLTVLAFVLVGWLLLRTDLPPINGWACLLVAAATIPGDLNAPFYAMFDVAPIGWVLEYSYLASAIALVLRYPKARLARTERWTVVGLLITSIGLRVPTLFMTGQRPDGRYGAAYWPQLSWPSFWHDWVFLATSRIGAAAILLFAAAVLVRRSRTSAGVSRGALLPLTVASVVCAVAAAIDQLTWVSGLSAVSWVPAMVRDLSGAAIPVALLLDLLQRRTAAALIGSLVLPQARRGDAAGLQIALRQVLADPSLLVLAQPSDGPRVGVDGRPVTASVRPERLPIRAPDGRFLCEIAYDPRAVSDPALLQIAADVVRIGLENTHLSADLLTSLAAAEDSRTRIIEAGVAERRKLERDLHDGAQQQFLAVAATLSTAAFTTEPEQLRAIADDAGARLRDALAELRRLARGIHPATLTQAGLGPALQSLSEISPLPMDLVIPDAVMHRRYPPAIESSAYFVVAEAVANAAKHAGASRIRVSVVESDEHLEIGITDDGNGGAVMTADGGIQGLHDRVLALGGTLTLDTAGPETPGPGTRLIARFPLTASGGSS